MKVTRIRQDFVPTVIINNAATDPNLNDKALGLLFRLLCYRDGAELSMKRLAGENQSGLHSVRSSFKKLEETGYVSVSDGFIHLLAGTNQ